MRFLDWIKMNAFNFIGIGRKDKIVQSKLSISENMHNDFCDNCVQLKITFIKKVI